MFLTGAGSRDPAAGGAASCHDEGSLRRCLPLKALLHSNLLCLVVLSWIFPKTQRSSSRLSGQQGERPGCFRSCMLSLPGQQQTVEQDKAVLFSGPEFYICCVGEVWYKAATPCQHWEHALLAYRTCS